MDSDLRVADIAFQQERLAADHTVHQEVVFDKIQHLVRHVKRGGDALFPGSICDTLRRQHITHSLTLATWTAALQHPQCFGDSTLISLPVNECTSNFIGIRITSTDICLNADRQSRSTQDCWADKNVNQHAADVYVSTDSPAEGSRMVLTTPGRGSGTGWLYVYHCWVSRLTSRYRPLNAFSTWSIVKAHTAELPEAPLYLIR